MYGVVREFQSPQGVTHAARGRFLSSASQAVIFARKTTLDLYVVRANRSAARLEHISSTPLDAPVHSLAVLRRPSADLLVLGFRSMRIAILCWLHEHGKWHTVQLLDLASLLGSKHCSPPSIVPNLAPDQRTEALLRGSVGADATPVIRADPAGRCLTVLAKEHSALYVIPILGEDDSRLVNRGDVFLIDLFGDYEALNVRDFTFLNDSFEPNILILHEPKPTWAGRAAIKKDTGFLLNITVDLRSKRASKTWTMDGLPYDCCKLVPIPESAEAGALVLSASVIFQVRHGACVAGLSLNCFGDAYAKYVKGKYDNITRSDSLAECDASHCRFLDVEESLDSGIAVQSTALLSLKGGELYFINVAVASRSTITMKRAGSTVIASEIVPINHRFFVLASRLSDSLLIEYQSAADDETADPADEGGKSKNGAKSKPANTKRKKRKRTAEEETEYEMIYGTKPPQESSDEESDTEKEKQALELEEKVEGTRGVYDDDDELGWVFSSGTETGDASRRGKGSGRWALKVMDTLPCFGPGADLAIGPSPDDVTATKLDMVIAGGYGKNGCLAVVQQSVRPTYRLEFEVDECTGVWTLLDPDLVKRERVAREKRNKATKKRNEARKARNTKKLAERQAFIDEAIEQLKRERKEREEKEREEAKKEKENGDATEAEPNGNNDVPDDAEQPRESDKMDASDQDDQAKLESGTKVDKSEDEGDSEKKSPDDAVKSEDVDEPPEKKAKTESKSSPEDVENGHVSPEDDRPFDAQVMVDVERQAEENYPLEPDESLEDEVKDEECLHSYMLLSTPASTTILKTGVEIEEVMDSSVDFISEEKTVAAGNVFTGDSIVQVVSTKVRVLRRGKTQCEYSFVEKETRIKRAQVCDPLILVETEDGRLVVLSITAEKFEESASDDAQDDPLEADLFEEYEYGLAGPTREQSDASPSAPKGEPVDGKSQSSSKTQGYRNFTISVEFSEEQNPEIATSVTAAYLYKGSLAGEIAKDGVLEASKEVMDEPGEDDLFKDTTGSENEVKENDKSQDDAASQEMKPEDDTQPVEEEDRMLYDDENEEDFMLYGDSAAPESRPESDEKVVKNENGELEIGQQEPEKLEDQGPSGRKEASLLPPEKGVQSLPEALSGEIEQEHMLVVVREDGSLFVLSRSLQYAVVLRCPVFFAGPAFFRDTNSPGGAKGTAKSPAASDDLKINSIAMLELSGSALLPGIATPILVASSRLGVPLVYRAYLGVKEDIRGSRSRLLFKKVTFRDRTAHLFAMSVKNAAYWEPKEKNGSKPNDASCHSHFQNIAGRGGLFVGGRCPFFVFAERGHPRVHPLSHTISTSSALSREEYENGEGVIAFAEFHNTKCPRGFVSVSDKGTVKIGELPAASVMNFDSPAPMRKIALRCTPHKVAYHAGSATYGVLASMPTLTTREERLARILQSLEKHDKRHYQHTAAQAEAETVAERAKRVPPLFEELHELRVYRPDTWELIKNHKLQKGEVGLAIANMTVDVYKPKMAGSGADIPSSKRGDDGNESAFAASSKMRPKNMLVVGTGHLNGEDASSRGRLLMFEISKQEIYTEDQVVYHTAFQLQLIAEKELFSPVTAVAAMEGYVIAGVGPQVSVYKLVGDEIIHLSFAFGQLYCSSLSSLKQYVVAADMCKSVSFMYFRDRNNSVSFLGKDYEHVTSYSTEFLIENENMSIIVSDGNCNFQMMNYAHASVPESRGGKRLLINGGLNFGSRVNKLIRVRAPNLKKVYETGRAGVISGQHSLIFATLDGGIGGVIAVTETEFKKLEKLHAQMIGHAGVPRCAGVNLEEHTAFRPESSSTVLLDQRLLDSRAIFDLFGVSLVEMRMIAREFGDKLNKLVESLLGVDLILSRF